jgi:G3E family GTPase
MSMPTALPVTVLTGFLGSGKTTVLNRVLGSTQRADTAVIVNEFGEVGLDHLLVEQAIEDAVLLRNGCICCTVRGDIADTLLTLLARCQAGELPPFRRVVIETTGLADPAPVAHTLATEASLSGRFRLDGIVTTADALLVPEQTARQEEARRQLALADRILLTKSDLAGESQLAAAVAAVRRCNATAPMLRTTGHAEQSALLFDIAPSESGPRAAAWLGTLRAEGVTHAAAIGTVLLRRSRPIARADLRYWLNSLLSTRGQDVLRLKGLVHLQGEPRPLVLQAVQHVLHPPAWLERPRAADFPTEIVAITRGLSPAGLQASFAAAVGA